MKRFLIDDESIQLIEILTKVEKEFNLINVFNFDDGIDKYKNNTIDFVIVDFSDGENERLFKEILKINPKQKAITLSEKVECSCLLGCHYCVENFNKRRLLKPLNLMDLLSLIKNFDDVECKYYNDFKNIETIMDDIVMRYLDCSYDPEKKIIRFENNDYHTQKSMLDLSNILKEHNVFFKVIDEHTIQIGDC